MATIIDRHIKVIDTITPRMPPKACTIVNTIGKALTINTSPAATYIMVNIRATADIMARSYAPYWRM